MLSFCKEMSLRETLDQISIKSRQKVDGYVHKAGRLSSEATRLSELSSECGRRARGLESFVSACNANYDARTNRYRCLTTESRTSVESEILKLEQAIAEHPGARISVVESEWQPVRDRAINAKMAFIEPFFDDSECSQRKLLCEWRGEGKPIKPNGTIDINYFNQNDAKLVCTANRSGKRVMFAPQELATHIRAINRDAKVFTWAEAQQVFGNEALTKSFSRGPCDV